MIHQRARRVNLADGGVDRIWLLRFGLVPGLWLILGLCQRILSLSVGPLPASGPVSFRLWPLPI